MPQQTPVGARGSQHCWPVRSNCCGGVVEQREDGLEQVLKLVHIRELQVFVDCGVLARWANLILTIQVKAFKKESSDSFTLTSEAAVRRTGRIICVYCRLTICESTYIREAGIE